METRYAFVARQLAEAIASGRHAVGSVLPNEFELAGQFGVSRGTVRAALNELQQLGLIARRRNAGTRVVSSQPVTRASNYGQSLGTVDDVVQYAADTRRCIQDIADEVADRKLAARLKCQPGRRWLRVSSIRIDAEKPDSAPICWTDNYIDEQYAKLIRVHARTYTGALGELIEERTGRRIAEIKQVVSATGVPERIAAKLQAEPGAHALEITRSYLDGAGEAFMVSISIHPADRYSYAMRLLRQGP